MDATDAVKTKLDIREFGSTPVPKEVKLAVLEAARLTQSGNNSQHWRFILVQDPGNLRKMSEDSPQGRWVKGASFAVIVCTDPSRGNHMLDAGRAVQDMQLTAWDRGVGSGVFMGVNNPDFRRDFGIPEGLNPTIVVGFGYPVKKLFGRKDRLPLASVAYLERYGGSLDAILQ